MVAFNFQKTFEEKILDGSKSQTIRSALKEDGTESKRHWPKVGSGLQIYFGLRTKHVRKILSPDPTCRGIEPVVLNFGTDGFTRVKVGKRSLSTPEWLGFSQDDGFDDPEKMYRFWRSKLSHTIFGDTFRGYVTSWKCSCKFAEVVDQLEWFKDRAAQCKVCGGVVPDYLTESLDIDRNNPTFRRIVEASK